MKPVNLRPCHDPLKDNVGNAPLHFGGPGPRLGATYTSSSIQVVSNLLCTIHHLGKGEELAFSDLNFIIIIIKIDAKYSIYVNNNL